MKSGIQYSTPNTNLNGAGFTPYLKFTKTFRYFINRILYQSRFVFCW